MAAHPLKPMNFLRGLPGMAVVVLLGCVSTHTSPPAWKAITEGMDRGTVAAHLGPPMSKTDSSDVWRTGDWELHVAYDTDGRATHVLRTLKLE